MKGEPGQVRNCGNAGCVQPLYRRGISIHQTKIETQEEPAEKVVRDRRSRALVTSNIVAPAD